MKPVSSSRWFILVLGLVFGVLLVACGDSAGKATSPVLVQDYTVATATSVAPASVESAPASTATAPTSTPHSPPATTTSQATLLPKEPPPAGAEAEFRTDFSRHSVPYDQILSGGVPKDGIPAIDTPAFVSVNEADAWLEPMEPVVRVAVGDDVRAYPIQVLMWHEIVNDTVGNTPLLVSFCPLCNTAIVFERTVAGQVYDFGTTGRLRYSNLVMYDRQTETWWQQATGEAIAGELTGQQLAFFPAGMIAWQDFRANHPAGTVLSRDTGYRRSYGQNPYVGYDHINASPFLYDGPATPGALPALARVLAVEYNGEAVAYPFEVLTEERVINDEVGGSEIVVFWSPGTASALDQPVIAQGRDIGSARAYRRSVDDTLLRFGFDGNQIADEQTGSTWTVEGLAVGGPMEGETLEPVVAINHFWFSWAAFRPETRVYTP